MADFRLLVRFLFDLIFFVCVLLSMKNAACVLDDTDDDDGYNALVQYARFSTRRPFETANANKPKKKKHFVQLQIIAQ